MKRRTRRSALAALVLSIAAATRALGAAAPPAHPARNVDETMPTPMGTTRLVHSGDDLQAVINAAQAGDVIQLDAGATFTGNFVLPVKAGADQRHQIIVRSSAYASLPAGKRIEPGDAGKMAKIVARGMPPAITFSDGASYYRLIGLEIATTWSLTSQTYWQLVCMGRHDDCSADVKTEASLPHHVIFDRVYVHGTPTGNARRGIPANAAWVALVDSYISDIHEVGADTQAFGAWNGTGPYLIRNNYLEAGAENIMLGGADASIPNLVASDVTVIHNTFYKPDSWNQNHPSYGRIQWSIKNLFELKNAQRVLLYGNVFDNCWGIQAISPATRSSSRLAISRAATRGPWFRT